jgi:hypothetical protein
MLRLSRSYIKSPPGGQHYKPLLTLRSGSYDLSIEWRRLPLGEEKPILTPTYEHQEIPSRISYNLLSYLQKDQPDCPWHFTYSLLGISRWVPSSEARAFNLALLYRKGRLVHSAVVLDEDLYLSKFRLDGIYASDSKNLLNYSGAEEIKVYSQVISVALERWKLSNPTSRIPIIPSLCRY